MNLGTRDLEILTVLAREQHMGRAPERRGAQKARAQDGRLGVEIVRRNAAGGARHDANDGAHWRTARIGGSGGSPAPRLLRFRDSGRERSRVDEAGESGVSTRSPLFSHPTNRLAP